MDSKDQETASTLSSDEAMLFAAVTRLYITALPISSADMASYWEQLELRMGEGAPETRIFAAGCHRRGSGTSVSQTLRRFVRAMLGGFADSAMTALAGRKVTTLTAAECERLRNLVEQAEPED